VAVKVLRPEIAESEETVSRFVREARAAAKVNHPNLTHIYYVGGEGRLRFFAREFLPGRTLEQVVGEEGPLSLERAVDILVQAARGLAAAHGAGVVHRDVKPGNLILLADGTLKVTDFGLAKSITGELDLTGAGRILGTPRYMSPEQCRGEPLDARSDVYCVGLVGWYLLTGEPAFAADNIGKLLDDQMNRTLPPLEVRRPDLPGAVQRVLSTLAAKAPEDRPASMEAAIAGLERIRPRHLPLAPIASRGVALLVDFILIAALQSGIELLGRLLLGVELSTTHPVLFGVFLSAAFYVSQAGMEAWLGTTVGKSIFLLGVVRVDGSRPGLAATTGRLLLGLPFFLLALVPIESTWMHWVTGMVQLAAALAALGCYFFAGRRTLSDLLTGTRVVFKSR
jgi:serine/threonine-protein kinase